MIEDWMPLRPSAQRFFQARHIAVMEDIDSQHVRVMNVDMKSRSPLVKIGRRSKWVSEVRNPSKLYITQVEERRVRRVAGITLTNCPYFYIVHRVVCLNGNQDLTTPPRASDVLL